MAHRAGLGTGLFSGLATRSGLSWQDPVDGGGGALGPSGCESISGRRVKVPKGLFAGLDEAGCGLALQCSVSSQSGSWFDQDKARLEPFATTVPLVDLLTLVGEAGVLDTAVQCQPTHPSPSEARGPGVKAHREAPL